MIRIILLEKIYIPKNQTANPEFDMTTYGCCLFMVSGTADESVIELERERILYERRMHVRFQIASLLVTARN